MNFTPTTAKNLDTASTHSHPYFFGWIVPLKIAGSKGSFGSVCGSTGGSVNIITKTGKRELH